MIYLELNSLNSKKIVRYLSILPILFFLLTITFSPVVYAQTADSVITQNETQTTDTAFTNKTMKSVFKELKHITKTGNATLNSILMILGVVSVVGIAMWLSFRADPEEENA